MPVGNLDLQQCPIAVPEIFWDVRYNAEHFPGAPGVRGVDGGANCQQFAYTLLRHFGFVIPDFRSSELWDDGLHTRVSANPARFDLVLVHKRPESYGAHVGIYVGDDLVLHLSRQIDAPVVEKLNDLQSQERYHHLIGFKTVLNRRWGETG